MLVDFSKLGGSDSANTVLHPREIFTVLRKESTRYQYPRDVQAEVWEGWFSRRNEHDLVVKMNTGGGKTVVGLLILKSCLNEGKGPAVYVTPDPYLSSQVLTEARALGVEATDDAADSRFRRGQAILVANIYKLVNGKSVFGVADEGVKIPIGSLVIDDAHACLAIAEGQFTLRVASPSPVYAKLFALFREDLRAQSLTGVLDVEAHDPDKEMLVPYWAWMNRGDDVMKLLYGERKSKELEFVWPLLKDVLSGCQCAFGGGVVEISTRCLPIDAIPSFASAPRRVFMTATLADDSVLVTHFDASESTARRPITPSRADDVGDRLILVPQELNPDITDDELRTFAAALAADHNVVVIVPSHNRANLWAPLAAQVLDAKALPLGVEKLRAGQVGLTIIVNKYDGIDLPDNACRVLILDGLPDVRSKIDRIEQAMLYGSAQQTGAMIQKIEQGMGRGVRSNADYCVVMLTGRSLTRQLNTVDAMEKLTQTTRAQLTLSEKVAAQLRGKSIEELRSIVDLVLGRDRGWVDVSRGALVHIKYDPTGNVSPIAMAQRLAFNLARSRDYRGAAATLQDVVNAEEDTRVRGWLRAQVAEYTHLFDPVESQVILRTAAMENHLLTKPLGGIDYQRLRSADKDQGPAAAAYLAFRFPDGNHLVVELYGLLDQLKFEPDTAAQFERAVADLGRLLGFTSQHPEAEYGRGPDVLIGLGGLRYLVIECKNGVTTPTVSKSDCDQLSGSMNWFKTAYGKPATAQPVLIHPANLADRASSPHPEMRVITAEKLDQLKAAVLGFVQSVAQSSWPPPAKTVGTLLVHHGLTASIMVDRFTTRFRFKK